MSDFLNVINSLESVGITHGSPHIVCKSGKLTYLPIGGCFSLENSTTRQFPDFVMDSASLPILIDYLYWQLSDETGLEITKSNNTLFLKSKNSQLQIPVAPDDWTAQEYDGLDEVFLTPVLTYPFEVQLEKVDWTLQDLGVVYSSEEWQTGLVELTFNANSVVASTENNVGIKASKTIPFSNTSFSDNTASEPLCVVKCLLRPLGLTVYTDSPLKIRFKDEKSPVLFEYEEGVNLVVLPLLL